LSVTFAPLPEGPFAVVYADPPWKYAFTKVRAWGIDVHYPTLTPEEIGSLPVADIAGRDSVLFLWTTSPKLPEGLAVLTAWGFTYKTSLIWDKGGLGMGYWVRVNHEILLIGTKGKPSVPEVPARPASVLRAARRRHSQKPDEAYAIIEGMVPRGRRVELFARSERPGWSAWGLEA
jgi:N6-adenosine-specific RNA methylase IME4